MSRIVTVVVTIARWATVVLRSTFGQIFRNGANKGKIAINQRLIGLLLAPLI